MAPLDGVLVIELAWAAPGPYCGLLLSQLGADVVKVESPGGDPLRAVPAFFAALNANKRSLALDLKRPDDRAVFLELARRADALIEGFRPGVVARLGVDYASLSADNPRLVYVSISGFGQDGPYRQRAGHDLNYLAVAGLLGLQAQLVGRAEPPPVLLSDLASGLFAALGVAAALAERARTGRGRYLDLAMADTAANWLGLELARQAAGEPDTANLSHVPHYGVFRASDGKLVTLGVAYEQHFWASLCDRLDLPDLRNLEAADRQARAPEIRARLQSAFARRPAYEWEALLAGPEVPFAAVRATAEVPDDPQFRHRGLFQGLPGPAGERVLLPGLPFPLGEPRTARAAPALDEHGAELRAELER
jgi:crotonobetainyl-CoA:carnitine CoA-transferase CaiB-like acyl-CoA transferase